MLLSGLEDTCLLNLAALACALDTPSRTTTRSSIDNCGPSVRCAGSMLACLDCPTGHDCYGEDMGLLLAEQAGWTVLSQAVGSCAIAAACLQLHQ